MTEPRQVTAPGGKTRWLGADGRTYDTREEAAGAQAVEPKLTPRGQKPDYLKLHHLQGDGSSWSSSSNDAWVVAPSPEEAVRLCPFSSLPSLKRPSGYLSVYLYEGEPGLVAIGDRQHRVAMYPTDEVHRILAS